MKFVSISLHLFMMFFSVPIFSYVPVNATENTTTSSPINSAIRRNTWYNGDWCPIYIPEWWSPKVSRHPLDPYSFVHCQSGIIFFYLCGKWVTSWISMCCPCENEDQKKLGGSQGYHSLKN